LSLPDILCILGKFIALIVGQLNELIYVNVAEGKRLQERSY